MEWTPNELADDLRSWSGNREQLLAAANMLRQQEQKIAELEKDLFMLQKHYDQLGVRELTDEEIDKIVRDFFGEVNSFFDFRLVIRRCLKKAREK